MAYAPIHTPVVGSFVESDHGKFFEYSSNPDKVLMPKAHGGKNVVFPHLVYVGPLMETRMALVLSKVVHIVTDETADGFVVEKWDIVRHRKYK